MVWLAGCSLTGCLQLLALPSSRLATKHVPRRLPASLQLEEAVRAHEGSHSQLLAAR